MPKDVNELIDEVRDAENIHAGVANLISGIAVLIAQAGTYPETLHTLTTALSERADEIADVVVGPVDNDQEPDENDDPGFIDPATGQIAASPDQPTPVDPAPLDQVSNDDMAQLTDPAVNTSEPVQTTAPGLHAAPADNITGSQTDQGVTGD